MSQLKSSIANHELLKSVGLNKEYAFVYQNISLLGTIEKIELGEPLQYKDKKVLDNALCTIKNSIGKDISSRSLDQLGTIIDTLQNIQHIYKLYIE